MNRTYQVGTRCPGSGAKGKVALNAADQDGTDPENAAAVNRSGLSEAPLLPLPLLRPLIWRAQVGDVVKLLNPLFNQLAALAVNSKSLHEQAKPWSAFFCCTFDAFGLACDHFQDKAW